jgi:acetylornithine/succinyldiaminopimelate/putrescine aminotransferase
VIGDKSYQTPFEPLLPEIEHIEFNSTAALQAITAETACVIIEPVQGEAGIRVGTQEFLLALRKRCNQTGALLIFDEIQTGMGRTGTMFAFEKFNIIPDILLLAKGLGGGMPLGAFISSHEIMQTLTFNPVLGHITTFGGHPVSCAAALANIDVIINEKLIESIEAKSKLIIHLLEQSKAISQIRSAGLMIALQLDNYTHVKKVIDRCIENGVILDWFLFNDSSIRIAPPLTISEEQIREACSVIVKALIED